MNYFKKFYPLIFSHIQIPYDSLPYHNSPVGKPTCAENKSDKYDGRTIIEIILTIIKDKKERKTKSIYDKYGHQVFTHISKIHKIQKMKK